MAKFAKEWQSSKPNPDEGHLKALWQADATALERETELSKEASKRRIASIQALMKPTGLTDSKVAELLKQDRERAEKSLQQGERLVAAPPIDFGPLHRRDVEQAKANADRTGRGNPSWQGYIWTAAYAGFWSEWNGEAEETPNVVLNPAANRVDPRTQTWGEGWWDEDYSRTHAYLAFTFSPPSWGHLHVHVYPWLHGYYCLYSDDAWYKGEWARAEVDTWVDLHQNFWRARDYQRRFTLAGDELHPQRCGRIDSQYTTSYFTNVGAADTVTIRVGVRLYSAAQANGGRSRLDFQAGAANFVFVPYVYWYLHT